MQLLSPVMICWNFPFTSLFAQCSSIIHWDLLRVESQLFLTYRVYSRKTCMGHIANFLRSVIEETTALFSFFLYIHNFSFRRWGRTIRYRGHRLPGKTQCYLDFTVLEYNGSVSLYLTGFALMRASIVYYGPLWRTRNIDCLNDNVLYLRDYLYQLFKCL